MKPVVLACLALLGVAFPVRAEEAGALARAASQALGQAAENLAEADSARDRVAALTATIRAYESGLSAMRDGLRRAALEERALSERLTGQDAELGEILALLQKVGRTGQGQGLFHPAGAEETVRAGTLVAAMVPALEARTSALSRELADLTALRQVQEAGIEVLEDGLAQVREARLRLARAVFERSDLPPLAATDQAAMEALINSSETLAAFADSLVNDTGDTDADSDGSWRMPVLGQVIRGFNESDADGVRRPGWQIATEPEALVTAPDEATVRFAGEVPGSGLVAILETAPGTLAILAGLGQSLVRQGQIVAAGEPVGLMGGRITPEQEKLIETSDLGGQPDGETLYMEVRQGQAPVDPAAFLHPTKE